MKTNLYYHRKVICLKLKINAILADQANALRLFSLLKDKGYDAQLLDYFVENNTKVKLADYKIEKLLAKVK